MGRVEATEMATDGQATKAGMTTEQEKHLFLGSMEALERRMNSLRLAKECLLDGGYVVRKADLLNLLDGLAAEAADVARLLGR
jgi:hypothetical protein